MRILVTGNLGYIGSVLTEILNPEYEVIGYDIGFFKDSVLTKTVGPEKQIYKDNENTSCSTLLTKKHIYSELNFFKPMKRFPQSPKEHLITENKFFDMAEDAKQVNTSLIKPTRMSIVPKKTISLI